jgi:leucyl-tRNA synthetase
MQRLKKQERNWIAPIPMAVRRNGFKTPSKAQWLRCKPPVNAHIPMYAPLSRSVCALPLNLI